MEQSFETLAVHAGEERDANFGAVSIPIYTTSVFAFPDAQKGADIHNEVEPGYYYGRLGNPTTAALEKTVAELEGGLRAIAFGSGMAAISGVILSLAGAGDHIVAPASMYSTTSNLFSLLKERFGIDVSFVDAANAENYAAALRPATRIFWTETPSNPVLNITDLAAVAEIAKSSNIITVTDNTFATPFNQRPLDHGIDIVVHSATKYFGGHSDLTAGLVVTNDNYAEKLYGTAVKLIGGNIAPQVAWLVLRGIKTLALRMERHNANAFALANMFVNHQKTRAVHYPGLAAHPQNGVAKKQMRGFGGMIGLDVGSVEAGRTFVNNLKLATLATSLGGVETIVQHSASMTHAAISKEDREKAGITDGLLRLSIGIEGIEDLKADFGAAFDAI